MLEFGEKIYYIDLKALNKSITIQEASKTEFTIDKERKEFLNAEGKLVSAETYERKSQQIKEIDTAKYDILKTFIEYLMDYEETGDDALGADRALDQTPLGYKIIFNTLYKEGIIKEKE